MALVILANVKTFLGINNSEKDDLLNLLIDQASAFVETKTQRKFESAVYTQEEYDGTGNRELALKHFPITTFTLFEVNNASDNSDDWSTVDSNNYWVDDETGIITKTSSFLEWDPRNHEGLADDAIFSLGKNRYRATYTAGYASVPDDIQYVCMAMISYVMTRRKNMGIKSETLGDHTVTFESSLLNDSTIKDVLGGYRDIPLA